MIVLNFTVFSGELSNNQYYNPFFIGKYGNAIIAHVNRVKSRSVNVGMACFYFFIVVRGLAWVSMKLH